MIKLKGLITEAPQKETIWVVWNSSVSRKDFYWAGVVGIVQATSHDDAFKKANADARTHAAKEIEIGAARSIRKEFQVRAKQYQTVVNNIKI